MAKRRQPKKKSSSNGIWIGSGISFGIVVLITIAMYFKFQPGPPDRASGAITEENLAKQTLETPGLPDLGQTPASNGSLEKLLAEAGAVEHMLTTGGYEEKKRALAQRVVQALHGAVADGVAKGVLDAKIPPKYFDSPDTKQTFAAVRIAVTKAIQIELEAQNFDAAQIIAVSYLNLGQQIYEGHTRLKSRERGLAIMASALNKMRQINHAQYDDGEIDEAMRQKLDGKVAAWDSAVKAVRQGWNSKLKTTQGVMKSETIPNIADLIRIAREDKDITFRIWAARRLGYALYERGEPGNQAAIKDALEQLQADENKLVADAAADGASIQREEYAELRK